ncbi:MAG TPA: C4-type zinc ribbon domain-containing protein [Chthoniobacterales bacterium]
MLPAIEQLLVVQDRDRKLKALRTELATLPAQRQRVEQAYAATETALEQVKQQNRAIEVQRKKLELEVKSRQETLGRYRAQQMQTRKNEEFQALGHEIARAEQDIVDLEDRQIELMEAADVLQRPIKEAEEAFQGAKTQNVKQFSALRAKEEAILAQIQELEKELTTLTSGIDPELLARYQRLFVTKEGSAVVPIEHEVCMGCHMKNTTTLFHRAKLGRTVVNCEQCGRLLYWDGN